MFQGFHAFWWAIEVVISHRVLSIGDWTVGKAALKFLEDEEIETKALCPRRKMLLKQRGGMGVEVPV